MREGQAIYPASERSESKEPPLLSARLMMMEALTLLDQHSRSLAAAHLDLALHHLDGELQGLPSPA